MYDLAKNIYAFRKEEKASSGLVLSEGGTCGRDPQTLPVKWSTKTAFSGEKKVARKYFLNPMTNH